jgi:hypothetical protein
MNFKPCTARKTLGKSNTSERNGQGVGDNKNAYNFCGKLEVKRIF